MALHLSDLEKGQGIDETRSQQPIDNPATSPRVITLHPAEKLRIYRELVGITATVNTVKNQSRRPVKNLLFFTASSTNTGTYKRVLDEEWKASILHFLSASTVNVSLVLQVLTAASITALSAFSGYHVAVTVLGVLNTAIASVLAYVKGQGLPYRMLRYRNQMRRVREYIEFKDRQFEVCHGVEEMDPFNVAEIAKSLYEAARKDQEDNDPGSYISAAEKKQVAAHGLGNNIGNPSLAAPSAPSGNPRTEP